VTAAGFLDYRDTSLRAVATKVNAGGITLDAAYRLEIASLDVYLDNCRQQRALSGLPAIVDDAGSSAVTTVAASAGAAPLAASLCTPCKERDRRIKQLENILQQAKNSNQNKRVLLIRWEKLHGALPADGSAATGAASGGGALKKAKVSFPYKKKK
jgi:hypothetical protein